MSALWPKFRAGCLDLVRGPSAHLSINDAITRCFRYEPGLVFSNRLFLEPPLPSANHSTCRAPLTWGNHFSVATAPVQ